MKLLSAALLHCPIVADVMSEIAADYFPGVRIIEEATFAPSSALDVIPTAPSPLRRIVKVQSGWARHATVNGEVVRCGPIDSCTCGSTGEDDCRAIGCDPQCPTCGDESEDA